MGTKIISTNRQLMEANPNAFKHEISVKPEGERYFPVVAITNLDHVKMLHLAKGEIVGFAHNEEVEMHYIETTNTLEINKTEHNAPRNWITERSWRKHRIQCEISPQNNKASEYAYGKTEAGEISPKQSKIYLGNSMACMNSEISREEVQQREQDNASRDEDTFDTDFLISPGDIYPNRKVKLEDAEITAETRRQFKEMCNSIFKKQ